MLLVLSCNFSVLSIVVDEYDVFTCCCLFTSSLYRTKWNRQQGKHGGSGREVRGNGRTERGGQRDMSWDGGGQEWSGKAMGEPSYCRGGNTVSRGGWGGVEGRIWKGCQERDSVEEKNIWVQWVQIKTHWCILQNKKLMCLPNVLAYFFLSCISVWADYIIKEFIWPWEIYVVLNNVVCHITKQIVHAWGSLLQWAICFYACNNSHSGLRISHIVSQRFSCKCIFKNMLYSRGVFHIMGCARINAFVAKPVCVLQLLAIWACHCDTHGAACSNNVKILDTVSVLLNEYMLI
jgi:hypothetical protein